MTKDAGKANELVPAPWDYAILLLATGPGWAGALPTPPSPLSGAADAAEAARNRGQGTGAGAPATFPLARRTGRASFRKSLPRTPIRGPG